MSHGMLCSGKELGLSDDGAGLLILGDESPGEPGTPIMEALGLRVDTVFDITVEGNRPDAWCISGIARDLAGRLELPFTLPEPPEPAASGWPVEEAASASVESADLCPRLTVSVLRDVTVAPSPAGSHSGCCWPACARSTTWSTPRTTSCSSSGSPPTPTTCRSCPDAG